MILKNTKIIPQILFVLISFVCNGQEGGPPPPMFDDPPPPPGLPIDGGLVVIQIIGVVYGLYVFYHARRKAFAL